MLQKLAAPEVPGTLEVPGQEFLFFPHNPSPLIFLLYPPPSFQFSMNYSKWKYIFHETACKLILAWRRLMHSQRAQGEARRKGRNEKGPRNLQIAKRFLQLFFKLSWSSWPFFCYLSGSPGNLKGLSKNAEIAWGSWGLRGQGRARRKGSRKRARRKSKHQQK